MLTLKLTAIGNSVGVVLPKEALTALKLEKGDTIYLTESPGRLPTDALRSAICPANDPRPADHEETA